MANPWVIKLTRPGKDGDILIQVSPCIDGQDFDLLATEGESPFRGKSTRDLLKKRKISC